MSCNQCCIRPIWYEPVLTPIAVTSEVGGEYLRPSGPTTATVVPHIHADASVTLEIWDGVAWSTSPLVIPPGGLYNYWMSFVPPSAVTNNYGGVTSGALAHAWTTPVLGELVGGKFPVAGLIAGVPTLALYSSTLATLSTIPIAGTPTHIAYNGTLIVVAGVSTVPGQYYLSVYGLDTLTGTLVLLSTQSYGVPVTSLSLVLVDTTTPGVTTPHTVLLVTTDRYYLAGELVTVPAPVLPLSLAPAGDLMVYELFAPTTQLYLTPPPALLFAYRYGGLQSASYSRRKRAIFALNDTETVISFSAMWSNDGLSAKLSPESESVPGATGVYVVDGVGFSHLLAYGENRTIVYNITELPV